MEKKAAASEHSPSLDQNPFLEQSAEQDSNSCNFVNLVSHGRTHHGLRDGDLRGRSSMTSHSSYSGFTGSSTSEAEPSLFQRSAPNPCLSFHSYKRRVRHADDGTVSGELMFDLMLPVTIGDVTNLVELDFDQGETVISNMPPNAFQPSGLPIPGIDRGIMGSNCQIDKSLNQSNNHHGYPGYNGPFSLGHANSSTFMIRPGDKIGQAFNFGQQQHLVIPGTSSEPNTGLESNIDQGIPVYHTGGAGYNQLSMQTGRSPNVHCLGENKNNTVPYTGPGLSMHASNINPTPPCKYIMHHLPIYDQNYLQVMQNGSLDDHAAPTRTPDDGDNVSHITPRGLDRHCRVSTMASTNATGVPDQLFLPPVQKVYQNNMRNSVANPVAAQMLAQQHTLSDQNMRNPGDINSANANNYYVSSQHAATCYQGLATQQSTVQDFKLLNANKATVLQLCPDGIPRDPTPVDGVGIDLNAGETQTKIVRLTQPSSKGFSHVTTQASGNKSVVSRSDIIKPSRAPSSMQLSIPAPQGEVAPSPPRGTAPAGTLLWRGKPRTTLAPPSSLQRRAAAPAGLRKTKPSATIHKPPDIIRRSNARGRGSPAPLGARCDLCGVDLAFTPSGAASGTSGDPPASAVHPCGHHFHDACLQEIGVSTDCGDPPCIACGFIEKTQTAGGR